MPGLLSPLLGLATALRYPETKDPPVRGHPAGLLPGGLEEGSKTLASCLRGVLLSVKTDRLANYSLVLLHERQRRADGSHHV